MINDMETEHPCYSDMGRMMRPGEGGGNGFFELEERSYSKEHSSEILGCGGEEIQGQGSSG